MKLRLIAPLLLLLLAGGRLQAGSSLVFFSPDPGRPKLVVGIVVDQMRREYLYRYAAKFDNQGFRRLIDGGFSLDNAHYNYVPTVTGAGHASIYTGATPAGHGIIANSWYDRALDKMVGCVEDSRYISVGGGKAAVAASPWRMAATTITDELKLATQRRAKVIGVSLKDRAAILPAGHMADGAYWYDGSTGNFITSTYYSDQLPQWLVKFNLLGLADRYLNDVWDTALPIDQYTESDPENKSYLPKDNPFSSHDFPYKLSTLRKQYGNFKMLSLTPFGNDLLTQLALAAIDGEGLGKDETTDFLTLSYSSTDALGHMVGPRAIELEDMYIRLDKNIAELLRALDERVGEGQYLVFLTADHGVAETPSYAERMRILPHYPEALNLVDSLRGVAAKAPCNFKLWWSHQIYLAAPAGADTRPCSEAIKAYLLRRPEIADAFTAEEIQAVDFNETTPRGMIRRGVYRGRSGDVFFTPKPGVSEKYAAANHSTGYAYDTHVPVLFYGRGIKQGRAVAYHPITDIAPTLAILLGLKPPDSAMGAPVAEALE